MFHEDKILCPLFCFDFSNLVIVLSPEPKILCGTG